MLSARITRGVRRARSPATMPVRSAHHATDPRNTPATTTIAPAGPPVPAPMLANRAAKDRMVAGLVAVSATIDAHAPRGPPRRPGSGRAAGAPDGSAARVDRSA